MRRFLIALALLPATALAASYDPLMDSIGLKGTTGTSGSYDARLSATGGGTQALLGTMLLKGATAQFGGWDSTISVILSPMPSAVDQVMLTGGADAAGGTIASYSTTNTNVDLNLSAQALGAHQFYNGAGTLLATVSPTTPVSTYMTITPATTAAPAIQIGSSFGTSNSVPLSFNLGIAPLILGCAPDGNATCGNTRGVNAVDFQVSRTQDFHVAAGARSFVFPGANSWANGVDSASGGFGSSTSSTGIAALSFGNSTTAGGAASAVFGILGNDRGNANTFAIGIGYNADNNLPSQIALYGLHASTTSTTPTRLYGGQSGGGFTVATVWNIQTNNTMRTGDLVVSGFDLSAPTTNWVRFKAPGFVMIRGALSTTISVGGGALAMDQSAGTGASAAATVAADTTLSGINVTVTAPNANQWHWSAMLLGLETQ